MRTVLTFILMISLATPVMANEGGGGDTGNYLPMQSLVVNLQGKRKFLRIDIQLLLNDPKKGEEIKAQMPALRHALIMLLGNRDPAEISNPEGREKLRESMLHEIHAALEKYGSKTLSENVEELFITDFIIQ